jgi:hypothetical protein
LNIFKSLIAEPCRDVEGSLAVMAHHREVRLGIEFLVGAGGNEAVTKLIAQTRLIAVATSEL